MQHVRSLEQSLTTIQIKINTEKEAVPKTNFGRSLFFSAEDIMFLTGIFSDAAPYFLYFASYAVWLISINLFKFILSNVSI